VPAEAMAMAEVGTWGAQLATPASPELLAAIAVAVRTHRRTLRKQAAPIMRSHPPGTLNSRWVGAGRTRQNRTWVAGGRHV
jgi:glutaconyl-CoA/methylmalonyl-CoA decarboxylase subunit delta